MQFFESPHKLLRVLEDVNTDKEVSGMLLDSLEVVVEPVRRLQRIFKLASHPLSWPKGTRATYRQGTIIETNGKNTVRNVIHIFRIFAALPCRGTYLVAHRVELRGILGVATGVLCRGDVRNLPCVDRSIQSIHPCLGKLIDIWGRLGIRSGPSWLNGDNISSANGSIRTKGHTW